MDIEEEIIEIDLNHMRQLAGLPLRKEDAQMSFTFTFNDLCGVPNKKYDYASCQVLNMVMDDPHSITKLPTINDVLFGPI